MAATRARASLGPSLFNPHPAMQTRFFSLLALLALVAMPALAQQGGRMGGGDPAERATQRVAQLDEALHLTDEQATALTTLLTEQMQEMQATMQAMRDAGQRPDRAAMQARREAHNKAVEALLTDEQITAFRKLLAEEEANRPRRGGRRNG